MQSAGFVSFLLYLHCIFRRHMRSYRHTAFTVLYRYDIFYGAHESDAGVGSGRRRQFLDVSFGSPQRCERVRNRTARFRCFFGSIDGFGV